MQRRNEKIGNSTNIKHELRIKYRKMRARLPATKKSMMDSQVTNRFLFLKHYQRAKQVLIYASKKIEVNTFEIIADAWQNNKIVALPRCNPQEKNMEFYYVNSENDLEKGAFGVFEPTLKCKKVTNFKSSICVVPGLCFDSQGFRLGYGMGYYDRFLQNYENTSVGLCYGSFMTLTLPRYKFDCSVNILVTDRYVKKFKSKHFLETE